MWLAERFNFILTIPISQGFSVTLKRIILTFWSQSQSENPLNEKTFWNLFPPNAPIP